MSENFLNLWLLAPLFIVVFFFLSACVWRLVLYLWKKRVLMREKKREINGRMLVVNDDEVGEREMLLFPKKREFMDIHFEELGLELKNGKSVLDGVNGSLKHGRLTAVMGQKKIVFFY